MNGTRLVHKMLTFTIAAIWIANGLFCKLLNLVPRHRLIIERIAGITYSGFLIKAIGVSELLMAFWILTGIKTRVNTITQILIIGSMNIIEFLLAPDLLLFGRINLLLALILIAVIYYNEFVLNQKLTTQT